MPAWTWFMILVLRTVIWDYLGSDFCRA